MVHSDDVRSIGSQPFQEGQADATGGTSDEERANKLKYFGEITSLENFLSKVSRAFLPISAPTSGFRDDAPLSAGRL
jgi:hypothetical protein